MSHANECPILLGFFISHIGATRAAAEGVVISEREGRKIALVSRRVRPIMTVNVDRERTVIRLEGVFDVSAAKRLAAELDAEGYGEVRIDMTRVREFHDFGVALLAQSIAGRRSPTALVGLHEHHLRLLRYLGIELGGANLTAGIEVV
jgi:hypothetical protein